MSPYPYTTRTRGFTLLELVIVLVILGILSALAVPRFSPADNTLAAWPTGWHATCATPRHRH